MQLERTYSLSSDEALFADFAGEVALVLGFGVAVSESESESDEDEEDDEEDDEEEDEDEAGDDSLEGALDFFAFLVDASEDELESDEASKVVSCYRWHFKKPIHPESESSELSSLEMRSVGGIGWLECVRTLKIRPSWDHG